MLIKISVKTPTINSPQQPAIRVLHPVVKVPNRQMRVLDFDIENRPLSYLGSDFTTAEVTAMAWAWTDDPANVTVYLLGETELPAILAAFVADYDKADMVTGHYIKGHDLPMVNGALMEFGMAPLNEKMVQDTKCDLLSAKGLSKSQESLGAMLNLESPKMTMNQAKWRSANRLTPEGLAHVRERVSGDVRQHIELRAKLLELGYLRPPRMWKSGMAQPDYTP